MKSRNQTGNSKKWHLDSFDEDDVKQELELKKIKSKARGEYFEITPVCIKNQKIDFSRKEKKRKEKEVEKECFIGKNSSVSHWNRDPYSSLGKNDVLALIIHQEEREMLNKVIFKLTRNQRNVVSWYYFGNKSISEIAGIMGKTEDAIHKIKERAMKNLYEKLKHTSLNPSKDWNEVR